jgi:hypothetical protein
VSGSRVTVTQRRTAPLSASLRVLLVVISVALSRTAHADVQRYALVVGNDRGAPGEEPLSYAESDARKVAHVLESLGDFPPENMVLLLGRDAAEVQRVLISLNARIRAESGASRDAVLFVYFSGHADARALHLGPDALEISLLRRLVQGSAADFRLLMLDACRSGALTRVKGARPVAPFEIRVDEQLSGEGIAFLTSSTADEDAQESDELRGSFFTHYFVSGLRGAADKNESGTVSVEEAYDYAYQHTLRASSRTLHGLQHPTFQFDIKGKGGIPLTWVHRSNGRNVLLRVPPGRTFVLFAGDAGGPVVAEVDAADRRRQIALEPGRYYARGRGADHLLEGSIELVAGEDLLLPEAELERVEYARLARKGGSERTHAHGLWLAYELRSPFWKGAGHCHGARAGYALDLPELTLGAAVGACRSTFENAVLNGRADELALHLGIRRVLDFSWLGLQAGIDTGVAWLHQSFDTLGLAPARNSLEAHVGAVLGATAELSQGFYLLAEASAQLHVFKASDGSAAREGGTEDAANLTAVFAWRPLFGAGKRF